VYDVAGRVTGDTQITRDALNSYPVAIRMAFGDRASHAVEIKEFMDDEGSPAYQKKKNGVPKIAKATRKVISGTPDLSTASTAYAERLWLTVRQELRRFQRLTLGYSKSLEMHKRACAMHLAIYNLCRKHTSLDGITPAMAAGIEYVRWTLEDVVRETARYHKAKEDAAFLKAFDKAGLKSPQ
jgi:IS1 family transposase